MSDSKGICYLVGAGPGDLGLVTLRAKECVEEADIIIFDYLCNPQMLAWAKPGAEFIYAGKKAGQHTLKQDDISALLVQKTAEGNKVARLKGGDPMIFGRGGEEAEELAKEDLAFEIVPGISSAIAGPAYAGIPVTHRDCNSQLTIFTGHEDPEKGETSIDYAKIANADGVKVMLMGVKRLEENTKALLDAGAAPDTPVALIRWATTGRQKTLTGTLETIAQRARDAGFRAPAIAVLGEVVHLRDSLNWFESRPLFGKRIVVTRTRKQAGALSQQLRLAGADVYELPTIRIEPPENLREFAEMVRDAHQYEWLLFTSPNGVDAFFDIFYKLYQDTREIGGVRIAAIGPGTAQRIKHYHLAVDLLPEKFVAEGLLEAIAKDIGSVENLKMLWVRAEKTRTILSEELIDGGAILDEAIAYRTVPETEDVSGGRARFRDEGADIITFTSSSAVECFLELDLPMPEDLQIASIGPITSQTIRDHGLPIAAEAEQPDIPGLVDAVQRLCEGL